MQTMIWTSVLAVSVLAFMHTGVAGSGGVHWTYRDATKWPKKFRHFCSGIHQSPVNIDRFRVSPRYFTPFSFQGYDVLPTELTAVNNGHSVSVTYKSAATPTLSEGGLDGEYSFDSYHFHWGSDSSQGSEHTVDHFRYPMELHMIHVKNEYGNLTEAVKHSDGLAVLGIMFDVSTFDNPALVPLLDTFENFENDRSDESTHEVTFRSNFPFSSLLPSDVRRFYRYDGGLTTPTCNEVVVWTVFQQHTFISEDQLDMFRELEDKIGKPIEDNYRPTQPLNGRTIFSSFLPF